MTRSFRDMKDMRYENGGTGQARGALGYSRERSPARRSVRFADE